MDLITEFLKDMRTKFNNPKKPADPVKILMRFHAQTKEAFRVNFDIRVPAKTPSTVRNRYAPLIGCPDARIVFSLRKDYNGQKTRFHRVMNGVIVKYPSWTLMSIMPEAPDFGVNVRYIKQNMSKYTIYPVKNSTMVALYYDRSVADDESASVDAAAADAAEMPIMGETTDTLDVSSASAGTINASEDIIAGWRCSSFNGIDVSKHTWLGKTTYIDAIIELCQEHPKFNFGRLNPLKVYIINFHHRDFHPLMSEPQFIELLYVVDVPSMTRVYDEDVGLPIMQPVDPSITIDTILAKCASSLLDYRADPNCRCFGFVLRRNRGPHEKTKRGPRKTAAVTNSTTKTASSVALATGVSGAPSATNAPNTSTNETTTKTSEYIPRWLDIGGDTRDCDIIIESKFTLFIRKTIDELPHAGEKAFTLTSYTDRIEYICMRAVLSKNDIRTIFPRLFPQFATRFNAYDELLTTIKNALIGATGCNGGNIEAGRPASTDGLDNVVAVLYDGISHHKLNVNSQQTESIIDDYVRNMDHLGLYLQYLKKQRA